MHFKKAEKSFLKGNILVPKRHSISLTQKTISTITNANAIGGHREAVARPPDCDLFEDDSNQKKL